MTAASAVCACAKFAAKVHRVLLAVLEFKGDLQIVRAKAVFRLGGLRANQARAAELLELLDGLLDVFALDEALRAGGQRPFARPVVDNLAGPAALMNRDLRHVVRLEIPDAPVAEFPARLRQLVEILAPSRRK